MKTLRKELLLIIEEKFNKKLIDLHGIFYSTFFLQFLIVDNSGGHWQAYR